MLLNFLNRLSGKYMLIVMFLIVFAVYIYHGQISREFLEDTMKMIIVAAVARLGAQPSQQSSRDFHFEKPKRKEAKETIETEEKQSSN